MIIVLKQPITKSAQPNSNTRSAKYYRKSKIQKMTSSVNFEFTNLPRKLDYTIFTNYLSQSVFSTPLMQHRLFFTYQLWNYYLYVTVISKWFQFPYILLRSSKNVNKCFILITRITRISSNAVKWNVKVFFLSFVQERHQILRNSGICHNVGLDTLNCISKLLFILNQFSCFHNTN